jgi:hypothetical protein
MQFDLGDKVDIESIDGAQILLPSWMTMLSQDDLAYAHADSIIAAGIESGELVVVDGLGRIRTIDIQRNDCTVAYPINNGDDVLLEFGDGTTVVINKKEK